MNLSVSCRKLKKEHLPSVGNKESISSKSTISLFYFLGLLIVAACIDKNESPSAQMWYERDLPSVTEDSLLWSQFFGDRETKIGGIWDFRNRSSDTSSITSFLDTCQSEKRQFQARLMHSAILHTRLGQGYTGHNSLVQMIKNPVADLSREDASVLCYTYGSLLKNQERHLEAMGLASLGKKYSPKGVIRSNSSSLMGAILLINERLKTAQHYLEEALTELPNQNYTDKQATLLTNIGVLHRLQDAPLIAVDKMKKALEVMDENNFDRRKYTLSQLIWTWEEISMDSAQAYNQQLMKLEEITEDTLSGSYKLAPIRQKMKNEDSEASIILKSFLQSSTFNSLPFFDKIEALNLSLTYASPEDSLGIYRQQESILRSGIAQQTTDYQLHFMEYAQEYIDQRIQELLPLNSEQKLQECFRLIEWDRQIDMLIFKQKDQSLDIENNEDAYQALKALNGFDFHIDSSTDSLWQQIGTLAIQISIPTSVAPYYPQDTSNLTFNSIVSHLSNDDASLITMFQYNDSLHFIGYHFDNWSYDKISIDQLKDFETTYLEDPYTLRGFEGLIQANFWKNLKSNVIILPSSRMELFPFNLALAPNQSYFYKKHHVYYTFGFQYCTSPNIDISTKHISGYAYTDVNDLDLNSSLTELPGSYQEILELKSIHKNTMAYFGKDVTTDLIKDALKRDDLVYIATHYSSSIENRFDQSLIFKNTSVNQWPTPIVKSIQVVIMSVCSLGSGNKYKEFGIFNNAKRLSNKQRILIYTDIPVRDQDNSPMLLVSGSVNTIITSPKKDDHIWKLLL